MGTMVFMETTEGCTASIVVRIDRRRTSVAVTTTSAWTMATSKMPGFSFTQSTNWISLSIPS